MCCRVQRHNQPLSWDQAGQDQERWTRRNKITAVVGTIFATVAVAGLFWGGYDISEAAMTHDEALFTEGIAVLGTAAVSAIVSTVAWTCLCMSRSEEMAPPPRPRDTIV